MMKTLAETSGDPLGEPISTLKQLFLQSVAKHADTTAIAVLHQASDKFGISQTNPATYLKWTYMELYQAAKRLATTFKAHGLQRGDPIAVLLLNGIEWAVIFWAALLMECPVVSLDSQASKNPEIIQHMLTVSNAKAVVAWDADMVATLHKSAPQQMSAIEIRLLACEGEPMEDWKPLSSFISGSPGSADYGKSLDMAYSESQGKEEDVVTILFTSGTTSLPKGCQHTNRTLISASRARAWASNLDATRSSVAHLPNFHVFALLYNCPYWIMGGKVVYPAVSFSPKSTLNALDLEQCTDFGAAPSHITQIADHPSLQDNKTTSLLEVLVGGAMVTQDILKACIERLGSSKASAVFGMTEGTPTIMHPFHSYKGVPQPMKGTDVSCGVANLGSHIRVCAPETRTPMERGEIGELHMGGGQVVRGYLAGAKGEFYEDDKGPWLATGDQAKMLDNGEVYVLGRFKDLIIRGGENIAPSRIEAVANSAPDVTVQVVAAPNEFSGEVPVAIAKYAEGATTSANSLREKVLTELGPTFALDDVIDIRELGLEDFPKTTTGKFQKVVLTEKVRDFVESKTQEEQTIGTGSESEHSLKSSLRQIWAGLLGVSEERLGDEQSLKELADSLTTMQFRALLKNKLQKIMSLDELVENDTIGKQARFLQDDSSSADDHTVSVKRRDGPPSAEDMAHAHGDASIASSTESCMTPLLEQFDLGWTNDVEDIIPTQDVCRQFLQRHRPQSSNHRHAYLSKVNVSRLQEVVQTALTAHPMLRTLAMDFAEEPYHVVIRAGPRWWKHSISTEGHKVKDAADVQRYLLDDPDLDFANKPGPLFRCIILHVESTNSAALIYQGHHSVFDAVSLSFFINSLDSLLGGSPAPERTSFKLWADTYHMYRDSAPANADAAYHAAALEGISAMPLWPNLRAPGCYKGCDIGWIDENTGAPGDPNARIPLDGPHSNGVNGVVRKIHAPGLASVKQSHSIPAVIVVKAAVAIFNAEACGSDVGIFSSVQASRFWPFMIPTIAQRLPDAIDIDGPTLTFCVNKITVDLQQAVGKMVQDVQELENELNKHSHAPIGKVYDLLGHDDAVTYKQVIRRQVFNWLPGLGSSEAQWDNLTKLQQQSRGDQAMLWNCNLADSETLIVHASYDDAQFKAVEVEAAVERIGKIVVAISESHAWDSKLSSVL